MGPVGQQKRREAGDPIKLVMAVHELIHACGLDHHASWTDPDLFSAMMNDAPDPNDPAKDREEVGSKNGKYIYEPDAQKGLFLSGETVARITNLWLLPRPFFPFPVLRFPRIL